MISCTPIVFSIFIAKFSLTMNLEPMYSSLLKNHQNQSKFRPTKITIFGSCLFLSMPKKKNNFLNLYIFTFIQNVVLFVQNGRILLINRLSRIVKIHNIYDFFDIKTTNKFLSLTIIKSKFPSNNSSYSLKMDNVEQSKYSKLTYFPTLVGETVMGIILVDNGITFVNLGSI